jgi:inner membrane protein
MPTILTHSLAGLLLGKSVYKFSRWKILVVAALCALLPDADSISFTLGIPYASLFGHRGISHSIAFAVAIAFFATWFLKRRCRFSPKETAGCFLLLFIVTMSHAVLDAMTSGGLGVAFFSPFSNHRYFFHYRPIRVAPIGLMRMFSHRGIRVLTSEILWVWIPCLLVAVAGSVALARGKKRGGPA